VSSRIYEYASARPRLRACAQCAGARRHASVCRHLCARGRAVHLCPCALSADVWLMCAPAAALSSCRRSRGPEGVGECGAT
jgi:hypothetical protein